MKPIGSGGRSFWACLLCAFMLSMATAGCGKKGPPVPPGHTPLAQTTSLKGNLEGDSVHLNWRPGDTAGGIKEYVVLRSQVDPAKPPCPGCPHVFQRVGTVAPDPLTPSVHFTEPAAPGFIYTYKVQPVGPSGETGPDSNTVTIDRSKPET